MVSLYSLLYRVYLYCFVQVVYLMFYTGWLFTEAEVLRGITSAAESVWYIYSITTSGYGDPGVVEVEEKL